ncbi:hypothetical protein [Actinoplanes xinjiangensis]|uniref:hypothetical protein n=1 Tax=Actinoplanes xinjiangensis TaxID=512350 RepID=UPI003446E4ED
MGPQKNSTTVPVTARAGSNTATWTPATATAPPLNGAQLRELRDGIGRLIGAVNDGQDDPGVLVPGDDEDEGAYIDWSSVEDGVRSVEFSDGDTAVVLDMPEHRLREWYERLALQVQLDEQDS